MQFPRITATTLPPPSLATLVSGGVREREPIEDPSAVDRVRGAAYGAVAPLRHLVDLVALGAVSAVVGAPEPIVLMVVGAAAAVGAVCAAMREAIRPTRPAQPALAPAPSVAVRRDATPVDPVSIANSPPRSAHLERIAASEWTRAAVFLGLGSAVSAGVLHALDMPLDGPLVLAGGLPLCLAGLITARKVGERSAARAAA